MPNPSSSIPAHLTALYGEAAGCAAFERLRARLTSHPGLAATPPPSPPPPAEGRGGGAGGGGGGEGTGVGGEVSERDSILITYADQVRELGVSPLRTLAELCEKYLVGVVSGIHILPFYPWSSDDGFSVRDYRAVDPALGDWDEVER